MIETDRDDSGAHEFEGADPLSVDVFRAFKRIVRTNRQLMMRMSAEGGGHPAQAGCMWVLSRHEGITQSELGRMLHIAPATVTTMLQRLERDGLVERWTDPDDQRLTRIRLTESGRGRAGAMASAHASYLDRVVSPLPEADRRELARLLNELADNVEKELER